MDKNINDEKIWQIIDLKNKVINLQSKRLDYAYAMVDKCMEVLGQYSESNEFYNEITDAYNYVINGYKEQKKLVEHQIVMFLGIQICYVYFLIASPHECNPVCLTASLAL